MTRLKGFHERKTDCKSEAEYWAMEYCDDCGSKLDENKNCPICFASWSYTQRLNNNIE